ncbi:MAG: 2Fe-2S iron-sulfur cluster-binding protein [Pseudomonadales bacterium]
MTQQTHRLAAPFGRLLNRNDEWRFEFEGRQYTGYAGDTLASALAANGVWLLGRSFKYHRPRASYSFAGQDSNALVQLPNEPNVQADRLPVSSGLSAKGQHYSGSLQRDRGALIERFSAFLPVGFYYKTFFRPRGVWERIWAPIVRRKAGLGVVNTKAESGYYDKAYMFYDLVVVGAGPAGLAAAIEAGAQGATVLLLDENDYLGGALAYARIDAGGERSALVLRDLLARVNDLDTVDIKLNTVCNGSYIDNWLAVIEGNRLYKVRAKQIVMAVGCIEQPAIFRGNDIPGVVQGSALQRLVQLYGVKPGQHGAILTSNEDGYGVALDLLDSGIYVDALIDLRTDPAGPLHDAAVARGLTIFRGHTVYEAKASRRRLASVAVRKIIADGQCADSGADIACDFLGVAVGYSPAYQLLCQSGATVGYDDDTSLFSLSGTPDNMHIAGSVNGRADLDAVLADGRRAGWRALLSLQRVQGDEPSVPDFSGSEQRNHHWPIFPHPKGKEFVDLDEDLTIRDIYSAVGDGYDSVELTKRYSTVGMGPSQGRLSALATARLVAKATGRTVQQTGVTTARPPFGPEKLGVLAGRSFYPKRLSSMHHCHMELGAQMMVAGAWMRPAFYGAEGQASSCQAAESRHVRENVGLIDVSTLGGIEVRGPDAAEMMQRMYTWNFLKQPVGRARYALMCNDTGVVIDDGVACRIHDESYYVTATTGGVDRVYQNMLRWNAQWRLQVDIANVTAAWCGVNLAGPNSRKVLAQVCDDIKLDSEAFPYMGFREGVVAGIPARVLRVGFVGELGFEIHVPQHYGESLWRALMEAGAALDIKPFGVEAQRLLRLEKGHIIIGQDTDAMTTPGEVHMSWAVNQKKPFFVGARTLRELENRPPVRALVGYIIRDRSCETPLEANIVIRNGRMTGRVTSTSYSPTMEASIGMAYVSPSEAEPGTRISIKVGSGSLVNAEVVNLPFYDPDNTRQEL